MSVGSCVRRGVVCLCVPRIATVVSLAVIVVRVVDKITRVQRGCATVRVCGVGG